MKGTKRSAELTDQEILEMLARIFGVGINRNSYPVGREGV